MDPVLEPTAPWLLRYSDTPENAYGLAYRQRMGGTATFVLRGHKMHTDEGLFNEIAAALQFPSYFGENWPALHECLRDLAWLPAQRYALLIVRGEEVLTSEPPQRLSLLIDVLREVAETWADPSRGDYPERDPIPFHTIVQAKEDGLDRWGADLPDLVG